VVFIHARLVEGFAVHNVPLAKLSLSTEKCIDWHFVVVEELMDAHVDNEQALRRPPSRCLDKFTQKEPLEDMVCHRCRNADGRVMYMSRYVPDLAGAKRAESRGHPAEGRHPGRIECAAGQLF
jgi:hypothetical protein